MALNYAECIKKNNKTHNKPITLTRNIDGAFEINHLKLEIQI